MLWWTLRQLKSSDPRARKSAAQALVDRPDPRALDGLLQVLGDEHSWVRGTAIEALGKIGDSRALDPLLALFASEQEWSVRVDLVEALGRIGDERALDVVLAALADEDDNVRLGAMDALGAVGSAKASPALMSILIGDEVYAHRYRAAENIALLRDPTCTPKLLELIRNGGVDDRRAGFRALSDVAERQVAALLVEALKGESHWAVREEAAATAGRIGCRDAANALRGMMDGDDADPPLRKVAAEALAALGVR